MVPRGQDTRRIQKRVLVFVAGADSFDGAIARLSVRMGAARARTNASCERGGNAFLSGRLHPVDEAPPGQSSRVIRSNRRAGPLKQSVDASGLSGFASFRTAPLWLCRRPLFAYPPRQYRLRFFQFSAAGRAQATASAVDEVGKHPHSGLRTLRRNFLRGQCPCNRACAFRE